MIPDLAVIVAAYVCFRMLEVCLLKSDRYLNSGAHIFLRVVAVLVILLTVIVIADILSRGTTPGLTP
jgi:hypothetical protein